MSFLSVLTAAPSHPTVPPTFSTSVLAAMCLIAGIVLGVALLSLLPGFSMKTKIFRTVAFIAVACGAGTGTVLFCNMTASDFDKFSKETSVWLEDNYDLELVGKNSVDIGSAFKVVDVDGKIIWVEIIPNPSDEWVLFSYNKDTRELENRIDPVN